MKLYCQQLNYAFNENSTKCPTEINKLTKKKSWLLKYSIAVKLNLLKFTWTMVPSIDPLQYEEELSFKRVFRRIS